MDEDDDDGRMMACWDTEDVGGGDPFARATGTFVIHLFDRDDDKRGDTTRGGQRRGDGKSIQQLVVEEAANDGTG